MSKHSTQKLVGTIQCPFCGYFGDKPIMRKRTTPNTPIDYVVQCPGCDAEGPWAVTPNLANKAWNFRFNYVADPNLLSNRIPVRRRRGAPNGPKGNTRLNGHNGKGNGM